MSSDREAGGWFKSDGFGERTASGETVAVVRKKALLRILACRDADRTKIHVTDTDVQATSEQFRQNFRLADEKDLANWIESQGLTEAAYARAMHDFTVVRLLEDVYAKEIDELVPDHIAISTARLRRA
jgi:hypothetical protein